MTLDADRSVTATFTAAPRARVGATGFSSIRSAYNDVATLNSAVIKLLEGLQTENVTFGRNIGVTLDGGYNASYSAVTSKTTINGRVEIQAGTVRVNRVVVK
ncbi:MAG TPA: hypothetical protein DDY22_13130 [Geobacter sp.]|nr:hypothetical protein [Geobacter sp.]